MTDPETRQEFTGEPTTPVLSESVEERGRASWLFIIVAVVLVGVALLFGAQIITVLYGIINPPMPPMPSIVSEASHTSESYGVDDWMFTSEQDPCAVVDLYQLAGAVCHVSPSFCSGGSLDPNTSSMVARCEGRRDFAIFSMSYEAIISRSDSLSGGTDLRLIREVNWLSAPAQD